MFGNIHILSLLSFTPVLGYVQDLSHYKCCPLVHSGVEMLINGTRDNKHMLWIACPMYLSINGEGEWDAHCAFCAICTFMSFVCFLKPQASYNIRDYPGCILRVWVLNKIKLLDMVASEIFIEAEVTCGAVIKPTEGIVCIAFSVHFMKENCRNKLEELTCN